MYILISIFLFLDLEPNTKLASEVLLLIFI